MKNALNYYYNLNPNSIHQSNKNYRCYINGEEYLLMLYEYSNSSIKEIYELNHFLLQNGVPCHQIVLNNNSEIITMINNSSYILLKILVKNRIININDILFFSSLNILENQLSTLNKSNWYDMWIKKIDYFEYQISQFGRKYPIIRESINYYIGLAETSISLFNNQKKSNLVVSHNRIKKHAGTLEFYNPLNFILDNKVRDLCEYIKERYFFGTYSVDEAKNDISKFRLNEQEIYMLITRMLFPTYYFDCYEEIILGNVDEMELLKIINKNSKYLEFLKELYIYFKSIVSLPEIEWLLIS